MEGMSVLVGFIGAYLIGSIPFGLLASKFCHAKDPRTAGSGNIGFTNVLRISGKKVGILTLMGDAGKGFLVAWLARQYFQHEHEYLLITVAVVLGHIFSIFLKFQGGKGVATALAAIGGLHLTLGLAVTGIWLAFVAIFRYSSGGAIAAFLALPILSATVFSGSVAFNLFATGISLLILFRHHENISRLLSGTESKLSSNSS
ncbi:MAG: glycerol-3-phosphate 1-O-acyltransferase PlsY [Nitrospirales bacterium]|nr:glycerol-3-phosphate 1-O-acyltransferase PlsY [Nitrospira sp.]MDR4502770.1 glycerol-3-phosphate 1-O-acyltransferase PlsY [Nitrospirales bacterium]